MIDFDTSRIWANTSRMDEKRWRIMLATLNREPFVVLDAMPRRDGEPDVHVISPKMMNMLLQAYNNYHDLISNGEFNILRLEINRLQVLNTSILEKLQKTGKLKIDEDTWKMVKTSILDSLLELEELHAEPGDDDRMYNLQGDDEI